MIKPYTGVGPQNTPPCFLEQMKCIGAQLGQRNFLLRSGGGPGAGAAFDEGARLGGGPRETYLPWREYEGIEEGIVASKIVTYSKACEIASEFHPAWGSLKAPVKKLMVSSVMQVLGADLESPSRLLICWAPNPRFDRQKMMCDVSGGAGLAVRLAYNSNIPCFHLEMHAHVKRIDHLCGTNFVAEGFPSVLVA